MSLEGNRATFKRGRADLPCAYYQAALIASDTNRDVRAYCATEFLDRERGKVIAATMKLKVNAKGLINAETLMNKKGLFDAR